MEEFEANFDNFLEQINSNAENMEEEKEVRNHKNLNFHLNLNLICLFIGRSIRSGKERI